VHKRQKEDTPKRARRHLPRSRLALVTPVEDAALVRFMLPSGARDVLARRAALWVVSEAEAARLMAWTEMQKRAHAPALLEPRQRPTILAVMGGKNVVKDRPRMETRAEAAARVQREVDHFMRRREACAAGKRVELKVNLSRHARAGQVTLEDLDRDRADESRGAFLSALLVDACARWS
jgi:hypothetical protein